MLRKKAAEELKKEQERKAAERRRIIEERCGQPKSFDNANEGMLLCFGFGMAHIFPYRSYFPSDHLHFGYFITNKKKKTHTQLSESSNQVLNAF